MPHNHTDQDMPALIPLHMPEPNADAVTRILQAAHAHPRKSWRWVNALRQAKAAIYLPQSRYIIMASMVGFFILLGVIHEPPATTTTLARNDLLFDVQFDEEKDPLASFWTAELATPSRR